jgi:hypothetical protein
MSRLRLSSFPLYGALIDLTVFCASFVFFGGTHGPIGPMIVLHVINAPVASFVSWLVPFEKSSNALDLVLMFAVVVMNGALYGLAAALVVASWRAIFRRRRST